MKLTFWGVRAEIPTPGTDYVAYGGNTCCVTVEGDDDSQIILDAGTGIINLAKTLLGGPCGKGQGRLEILLSHTHWDRIQGIPYFIPAFIPGNQLTFWGPHTNKQGLYELLDYQMHKEYNPIFALENIGSTIRTHDLASHQEFDGWRIDAQMVPQRTIVSVSYRIERDGATIVILGNVPESLDLTPGVVEFCRGADLLLHDSAACDPSEGPDENVEGHAVQHAITLARVAQIPKVALTYYRPHRTDESLDRFLTEATAGVDDVEVISGREGLKIEV
ncbi:MAG: MBL fold metallo-hydrolase [Candidatus Latescibacteria bacterium]|jgi:phosphoribosyl 1,2-cyclic phosphodiesterase|nr:MBL fold metallo-hydrolase [Candidatus Latescibacterota bacterium]